MEPMVIEVRGVPQVPPQDRMVDQLKIHFLKRRNSGGDVLAVIYPTSTPGQAYVIFESAKVPGVLECTHILDVHNRFYPIRVKEALLSEVDMQVEATLDLSMFPKQEPVLRLIKSYDFTVTERIPGRLQLKGSFLKLKLIRNQLVQLQGQEHHYSSSPSALHNGSSLGYDLECNSLDPRFESRSILRNMDKMDAVGQTQLLESTPLSSTYRFSGSGGSPRSHQSSHLSYTERNASSPVDAVDQKYERLDRNEPFVHRRSLHADGASSISANDASRVTLLQHTSPLNRDSASGGFPQSIYYSSNVGTGHTADTMQHNTFYKDSASGGSLRRRPSSSGDTWASSSHSSPSSSSEGMASFQEDTDIISFILTQRQNDVKMIEKNYGTEISLRDNDGLTTVKFWGKNSEKAKADLINIIKEISFALRTQVIHLKNYDHAEREQILERIRRNQHSGVVIINSGDVVKLVGSSSESFEMKQKLLGHKADHPRGRTMERGSTPRRSSSLPRKYKTTHHTHITDPEDAARAATKYTPSHYQDNLDEGKAPLIVRGPVLTPDKKSQRSDSESRAKNRTNKENSVHQNLESSSLSQEIKSPKQLPTLVSKLLDYNIKDNFKIRSHKK
ncbi:uncharacterized protein si:dkey-154b15.1 isoform X1 [Tachysurus vachellii]|uniref:uncharacterized protein si:dkey-154b15.1 isoform X1 n=1 Tax=Tachysurus vachellii TaxID=175792 RepID=UPI00296A92DA|nr:uncharacterized protein si:dkey-154b15.1 isoform X1 [Tachysurus vachellii]